MVNRRLLTSPPFSAPQHLLYASPRLPPRLPYAINPFFVSRCRVPSIRISPFFASLSKASFVFFLSLPSSVPSSLPSALPSAQVQHPRQAQKRPANAFRPAASLSLSLSALPFPPFPVSMMANEATQGTFFFSLSRLQTRGNGFLLASDALFTPPLLLNVGILRRHCFTHVVFFLFFSFRTRFLCLGTRQQSRDKQLQRVSIVFSARFSLFVLSFFVLILGSLLTRATVRLSPQLMASPRPLLN